MIEKLLREKELRATTVLDFIHYPNGSELIEEMEECSSLDRWSYRLYVIRDRYYLIIDHTILGNGEFSKDDRTYVIHFLPKRYRMALARYMQQRRKRARRIERRDKSLPRHYCKVDSDRS